MNLSQLAAVPLPSKPGMDAAFLNPAQLNPESRQRVAAASRLLRTRPHLTIADAVWLLQGEEGRLGGGEDVRSDMISVLRYLITFGFEPIVKAFGLQETSAFLEALFPDTFDHGDMDKPIGLGLRYSYEIASRFYAMDTE